MSDFLERIDDHRASIQSAIDANQDGMWTALPGIITKVDLTKLTCEVQPAIKSIERQTDGTQQDVTLPLLVDVPIIFMHGGKYAHTNPVVQDDECLVVFSCRCIDNWWQDGGVQPQFEQRKHDLSDGFAFVGPWSQKNVLKNVSTTTSQWRNTDGDIYQELDNDNQKIQVIVKGITVDIDASNNAITITGPNNINVTANQAIDITAPTVTVHGNLNVTGNLRWNTAGGGTDAATHVHSGVQGGLGTSGPPVPGS